VDGKIVAAAKRKSTSGSIKCERVVDFLYGKGVVLHEFVPRGQTVKGQFCLEVMKRSKEAERRNRPEGWKNKTWMLHHDNARAHTSLLVREFLTKCETTVVPQLPYSPHLTFADFFVPDIEIHFERSPISDDKRDRRRFAMGPTRCPAEHVPEEAETSGAVYGQWWRVL
jgi:hypothetical protein